MSKKTHTGNGKHHVKKTANATTPGGETHQQAAPDGALLTTNQGLPISDNQNSLKAGKRGPTLLEDFILREKTITLIMNAFLSALCMPADPQRMATFSRTSRCST